MDMDDMMEMGGMGGMDMGGSGLFQAPNMKIARLYWYFVAAVVALCLILRLGSLLWTLYAKRSSTSRNDIPSRATNVVWQSYHTIIAMSRELTYPQLRPFTGSLTKYFSALPLGQMLLLLAYWVMILIMLWSNVILKPTSSIYGYKWEIVGFRAAWVSITQLPLIYCLGGKANVISLVTGISYERLNWLHRWVVFTIFLTVIVHWSYFFREWWLSDFIKYEFKLMPMIKYGFGAWAVIGWAVITGFGFLRAKRYELWLLQHLATAGVLLWLLYAHVPAYARYNIWLSIGFVAFDRGVRGLWSLFRNLHAASLWQKATRTQSLIGFRSKVQPHAEGYLSLEIENVDFQWQPGQHVFISMPLCGLFESHPFTIANSVSADSNHLRPLQLYFKGHSGFTNRLLKKAAGRTTDRMLTFISGPWGSPPVHEIKRCNSLIFVASSTGAAFTTPLLEYAVQNANFARRITFIWIVRHESQLEIFLPRVRTSLEAAQRLGIYSEAQIFITQESEHLISSPQSLSEDTEIVENLAGRAALEESIVTIDNTQKDIITNTRSIDSIGQTTSIDSDSTSEKRHEKPSFVRFHSGRPQSWDDLLHPVIVEAEGETAIIACGGEALMADIRNYVAWISDQRAVHKGTGAQGIFLFTESYGW